MTWSLVSGDLPPGFALSPDGVLAGTSAQTGNYAFTIRVDDGSGQFDRPYKLLVAEDLPPQITTDPRLPDLRADEFFFEQLNRAGGVGKHTWEHVGGHMPNGMRLTPAGILTGTPGEEGLFSFTVRLTDSHPVSPQTTETEFLWSIAPKDPATLVVNYLPKGSAVALDGVPDEDFWEWNPIEKTVAGSPDLSASFALVYDRNDQGMLANVWLAVKVEGAGAEVHEATGVDLYADLLHNGEIIFNSDDYYLFYPRSGEGRPELRQGQRSRLGYQNYKVVQTADGYTLEAQLAGAKMFFGNGANIRPQPLMVYGFDIGVRHGPDGEQRLMWYGDTGNDDDTSGFGSILISQFPVGTGDLVEQNLAEWSFATGAAASDQSLDAARASAGLAEKPSLTLGPGLQKNGNQHYANDNLAVTGADSPALDPDDYLGLELAPRQGASLSLNRLDWTFASWGKDKVVNAELRWSDDGFQTHHTVPLSKSNPIDLMPRRSPIPVHADLSGIPGLQDVSGPIELRLYLWDNDDNTVGLGRRDHIPDILLLGRMKETHGEK